MDKFSYAIGLGIGQNLLSMGAQGINVEDFAQAIADVLNRKETAISHNEARDIVNQYFAELEAKMNAENIEKVFAEREVDGIYLNFSDPWPKDRHAKRRLTSTTFFGRYNKILKKDGKVEFKTDNRPLFEFSLESVKEAGWNLVEYTFDLHHHETMNEGNIMTEYEEKFSSMGNPICKLIADR